MTRRLCSYLGLKKSTWGRQVLALGPLNKKYWKWFQMKTFNMTTVIWQTFIMPIGSKALKAFCCKTLIGFVNTFVSLSTTGILLIPRTVSSSTMSPLDCSNLEWRMCSTLALAMLEDTILTASIIVRWISWGEVASSLTSPSKDQSWITSWLSTFQLQCSSSSAKCLLPMIILLRSWSLKWTPPFCLSWQLCKAQDLNECNLNSTFSFVGLSSKLPATGYVKMVDIWMVFTIFYPFLQIFLHSWIEILNDSLSSDLVRTIKGNIYFYWLTSSFMTTIKNFQWNLWRTKVSQKNATL